MKNVSSWVQVNSPVMPAFGRRRQNNGGFEASLGFFYRIKVTTYTSLYAMKPFSDDQTHKVEDSATLLPIKETELKWPAQTGVADPPVAIADNDRKGNFLSLFSVFLPTFMVVSVSGFPIWWYSCSSVKFF